jgi:dTDP-glucose 4,6-dehydratase
MMIHYWIAGGAGFIGSHFIRYLLDRYDDIRVTNYDKLTYAGNLRNLADAASDRRYDFVKGDICDAVTVRRTLKGCDVVVNFAAETHVDRSLQSHGSFIQTDVFGVFVLLEAARELGIRTFVQISTDEVYGSIEKGSFTERDPLTPRNPYAASKAGGEKLAYSYHASFGMPVRITRASNTFGSHQYPEKFIPLFATNALEDRPVPLYGDGLNVRDWLHVRDHCEAIRVVLERGSDGEVYNIAGGNERPNIEVAQKVLDILGKPAGLIERVKDRQGHDRRYSLDCGKLARLGWKPEHTFDEGLRETVLWYRDHPEWWKPIKESPEFESYYGRQYQAGRGGESK